MRNPFELLVDLYCLLFGHTEYIDHEDNLIRCRHCRREVIFDPYGGKWGQR